MSKLVVYGTPASTYVRTVWLLLEEISIGLYLDATLADRKFSFSEPVLQARMRQIMAIIDSYLFGPAISSIVIQRVIVPSLGRKTDEAKVKNAIAPAQTALEAIESLAAGSPYLLGSEASIADFYLIPILMYLSQTLEFEVITAQTPKLRRWRDELSQLPKVKKLCA